MKTIIIILTIAFTNIFVVFSQQVLLSDYLKTATDSNPGLQSVYKKYEMSLQRVPQVSSLANPTVSFAYGLSPIETRLGPQQAKISVTQMFPWFGTLNAKEKQAALIAQYDYEENNNSKNKLTYNI